MEGRDDGGLIRDAMAEILIGRTVPVTIEDPDSSPVVDGQIPHTTRVLSQGQQLGVLLVANVATSTGSSSVVAGSQSGGGQRLGVA